MLRIAVRWDFEPHPLLFASSGGGRSDKSCLPKVPSLLEKPKAPVASLHLQAGRGKQVQLHRINPFLQLSIPSSSRHFSAEQHRNNSTAQSSSLITPINHGDDKTKKGFTWEHLWERTTPAAAWVKKNNPCGLLGSANTFPEHSQSSGTSWLLSRAPAKV